MPNTWLARTFLDLGSAAAAMMLQHAEQCAMKIPLRSDLRSLIEFVAYYRHFHSITTPAERVIPGNIKKLFAEELNHIVEHGEISGHFKSLLDDFKANPHRISSSSLPGGSKLEAAKSLEKELTPEERSELLALLLQGNS